MPPNPRRGEIEACLDGKSFRLCLTLGALAELESGFGHEDMLSLAERFQSGRLSARDAQRIIAAGLRGGGHDVADDAVGRMQTEGGAAGFVDIVARLLGATFGGPAGPLIGAVAGQMLAGVGPSGSDAIAPTSPSAAPDADPSSRKPRSGPQGGAEAIRDPAPPEECPDPFRGTT
jgi:hypothetical protein